MLDALQNFREKYIRAAIESVPGKARFGNYRFLPFFFIFGASLEFLMINWTVGPNKTNFYTVLKRRRAADYLDNKEHFEQFILDNSPLKEVDLFVENNDFRFYCKPYYLRLNLPGNIVDSTESENEKGVYDFDKNLFTFKFMKQNIGENFDGLDLVTKLLTNPKKAQSHKIEEIPSNDNQENEDYEDEDEGEESSDEWFIEQNENVNKETENNEIKITNSEYKYGFAMTKSNVFSKLSSEYLLIFDIQNPDETPYTERTKLRIESEKFDEDHYLADIYDNEIIEESLLKYKPFWRSKDKTSIEEKLDFTQEEHDCLKSLPKRTYVLDKKEKFYAYSGLVDILFAYCYNNRINCGEDNVESGWTIAKLTSTLSWFDTFKSLDEVIIASFRRSLCFPLYRNWKLTQEVFKDLISLMKTGKKLILKTLIEIRKIFNKGDCRYLLNDLFITDYCIWIQYAKDKTIEALVESLTEIKISKEMVDFDLECIELAAKMVFEEQGEEDPENPEVNSVTEIKDNVEDDLTIPEHNKMNVKDSSEKKDESEDEINEEEISERLSNFLNIGDKPSENKPKIIELVQEEVSEEPEADTENQEKSNDDNKTPKEKIYIKDFDDKDEKKDNEDEEEDEINEEEIAERISNFLNIGDKPSENKPKIIELD